MKHAFSRPRVLHRIFEVYGYEKMTEVQSNATLTGRLRFTINYDLVDRSPDKEIVWTKPFILISTTPLEGRLDNREGLAVWLIFKKIFELTNIIIAPRS